MSTGENSLISEMRNDIKQLMSDVATIKAKFPCDGLKCDVHSARVDRCQRDVDEVKSDVRYLTKKFYISYGIVLALMFLLQYGPAWLGSGKSHDTNRPTIAQIEPTTNRWTINK